MPANTTTALSETPALLSQLIYRAGFDRHELEIVEGKDGGFIRLPAGMDPITFKVRDLGHMLKSYGLPYEIMTDPAN
ncbi:hypothetical protein [Devosia salina]|uniref:Uncharacterized protein n=1 Tax=Devosia salina TaxID=2860336 RepID=A0ABX8W9T0_9HYPH|nr:hypothetical protein [Devosia salina]QYO75553.1 hypothetical protein K1X15_13020 [Devosia salina]